MTASSKETGLPWSEGSDLVKSIPATEMMRDRQLAGMLTLTAVSVVPDVGASASESAMSDATTATASARPPDSKAASTAVARSARSPNPSATATSPGVARSASCWRARPPLRCARSRRSSRSPS